MKSDADGAIALAGDLMVVDDFYTDAEAVRAIALSAEYCHFGGSANFPGRESVRAYFTSRHAPRFAELVGCPVRFDARRWVFGKFRLATVNDSGRTRVHIDKVHWTAVVCLTHDEDATGGLAVYRHRATGLDRVPGTTALGRYGCRDLDEFDRRYVVPASTRYDAWDLLHVVPIRFNRCVLFRGSRLFHGISTTFGDGPTTGRLTQNFFFFEEDGR